MGAAQALFFGETGRQRAVLRVVALEIDSGRGWT
jgi:hypothetical protein